MALLFDYKKEHMKSHEGTSTGDSYVYVGEIWITGVHIHLPKLSEGSLRYVYFIANFIPKEKNHTSKGGALVNYMCAEVFMLEILF
jgi:hypothetical protein